MNESSTIRQCKTPGCKKPAEPNSEYCLACQQGKTYTRKHEGGKFAAFLAAVLLAAGGFIVKIVSGGKGSQKG